MRIRKIKKVLLNLKFWFVVWLVVLLSSESLLRSQDIPEPERLTNKAAGSQNPQPKSKRKEKPEPPPKPTESTSPGEEVPDDLVLQCVDMFVVNQDKQVMGTVNAAKCVTPGATCYLVVTKMGQNFSCVASP